jgi:hypothetical protein
MLSPAWLRRPLTVSGWLVLSALGLVLAPLGLVLAGAISMLTRSRKPLVLARVLIGYFACEFVTLLACGGLWLISGAGRRMDTPRIQEWHWRLLGFFVRGVAGSAREALGIEVAEEASEEAAAALRGDRPLIIFSRHAGPADTVLLVDRLITRFHRRPSVVFREAVTLDPSIDLLAHRLPHAALDTNDREACETSIVTTTQALAPRGVLLLFPEGGNFTPERRRRAVRHLRSKKQHEAADAADNLTHVLPPRPLGALAALQARSDADVVFAVHTGLGLAAYPREIWRNMPIGGTLSTRMWLVPRAEVPDQPDEQARWLTAWWNRIDEWIDAQGAERAPV